MKYCKNCGQNVEPTKKFSIGWFLINCLWIIGGGVYLLYWLLLKKKTCPICHSNNFEHAHAIGEVDNLVQGPTAKEIAQDKLDRQIEKNEIAKTKLAEAKAEGEEIKRMRKAGELPWQIKKAQKKQEKLNKVN